MTRSHATDTNGTDPREVARVAELAAVEGDAETLESAALELLGAARRWQWEGENV